MMRSMTALGVLLVALAVGDWLLAADTKQPPPRAKGQLPPGWGKLGLSDEQKQQIYKTQSEYRGKIDDLRRQIRQLEQQEKIALSRILTDAQKARLKEIALEKVPGETPKGDRKNPTEDKKP